MFAPSRRDHVDNPNPPKVTFRMVRGRVIPIVQGKQPRGATKLLRQELDIRKQEIQQAERGMRGVGYDDQGHAVRNFGTRSTFPPYFSELGFNSKKQFLDVLNKRKGKKYEAVVEDSISSLLHGRESSWGRMPPSDEFRVKTKQEFDNRGVVFRNIDGRVVPLRPGKRNIDDEVPF